MTDEAMTVTQAEPAPRRAAEGPLMRSPSGRLHAALGARVVLEGGWEMPASYGEPGAERARLRETIGVADVTARGKIDLRGRIDRALPAVGDGAVVARVADDWALVLVSAEAVPGRLRELEAAAGEGAMATDATHLYAGFALAGPLVADALARLTSLDPATLVEGAAAGTSLAEVPAVLVGRELPVRVVEAYVGSEFGRYAWETLLEVARGLGGGPVGWDALRELGWG